MPRVDMSIKNLKLQRKPGTCAYCGLGSCHVDRAYSEGRYSEPMCVLCGQYLLFGKDPRNGCTFTGTNNVQHFEVDWRNNGATWQPPTKKFP